MNKHFSSAEMWRRALEITAPIAEQPGRTFPLAIDELAERFEAAPALLSDRGSLSYRGLAERANRYARWALAEGIGAGDVVALLMPNCPDYLAIWLGITRIGGIVALINTNLRGDSLLHSIRIVAPRRLIVGDALLENLAAVLPCLGRGITCWSHGGDGLGLPRIDQAVANNDGGRFGEAEHHLPALTDRALYIYTSGTTGLPKAAGVSHYRLMQWSHWFAGLIDVQARDRMYNCLPMYHSVGGVVATGAMLVGGGSVVIRERFSASRFWDEIAEWGCSLFQYIGELCRYLVNAPPHPCETRHRLRLACGNGLRLEVWEAFQRRFQVPQLLEFYAATEGSFSLFNCDGKPGAIGRIPSFLAHRFSVALIKLDLETGEPVRDAGGLCIRCAADEIGEAIGKLPDGSSLPGRFEGYTDEAASERKLLRHVFTAGDAWYRSGDLMRKDRAGHFYFVDRIGETFRWKGENVSTAEVAETITGCPGIVEAVVYGVSVPGADGRAGMAAIVTGDGFDLARLRRHLAERLPDYAHPLFLRLRDEIAMTGTHKPQKHLLAGEGYDPALIADALYVNDATTEAFVPLEVERYQIIRAGGLRL